MKVTTGTTGAELFFERRDIVVARVDGELKDLDQPLPEGAQIEGITIESPDGLNVLRHSTAHVMAQAVQQLRPDAKLGIGPYITDGFYFDFDVDEPFTPEDLKTLEKMMLKIINQNQKFVRRVVTEDEAREAMKGEPYKLELLGKKNDAAEAGEGVNVEVGAGYDFVYTPHITKGHLYEVSGHLDWYKEGMFPAMHIDAELNEDGTVRKPGQDYYLKPMNCPMPNLN